MPENAVALPHKKAICYLSISLPFECGGVQAASLMVEAFVRLFEAIAESQIQRTATWINIAGIKARKVTQSLIGKRGLGIS